MRISLRAISRKLYCLTLNLSSLLQHGRNKFTAPMNRRTAFVLIRKKIVLLNIQLLVHSIPTKWKIIWPGVKSWTFGTMSQCCTNWTIPDNCVRHSSLHILGLLSDMSYLIRFHQCMIEIKLISFSWCLNYSNQINLAG